MLKVLVYVFCALELVSCTTPRTPKPVPVSEKVKFAQETGAILAEQLGPQLSFAADAYVQGYLDRIAQRIDDKNPDLHVPKTRVFLIRDAKKWNSYALPGGKLYLSIGELKVAQYDNELAALLSLQLAHLQMEHVLDALRAQNLPSEPNTTQGTAVKSTFKIPDNVRFFGKNGVFDFTDAQELDAVAGAVMLMYGGGYDPRGMLTLLESFKRAGVSSPYSEEMIDHAVDHARETIDELPPLRNPVVRTDSFFQFQKHLQATN